MPSHNLYQGHIFNQTPYKLIFLYSNPKAKVVVENSHFKISAKCQQRQQPYGFWPPKHPGYVASFSRDDYVVEAHFHVDHLEGQYNLPRHQTIDEFARSAEVENFFRIPFKGGVASYLVQLGYHRHTFLGSSLVYSCHGVHLKHAMLYNPEEQKLALARVKQAIREDEGVIAIGEIGLDYSHANQAIDFFAARECQCDVFFWYVAGCTNGQLSFTSSSCVAHEMSPFSRMKLLWVALTSSKRPVFHRSIPCICIVSTAVSGGSGLDIRLSPLFILGCPLRLCRLWDLIQIFTILTLLYWP